jgi:hypothetical protein
MIAESSNIINDNETVVRLISSEWIEDGYLLDAAFALAPKENYLSVLRPIISTFKEDLCYLVELHEDFKYDENHCQVASLNVNDVRSIKIINGSDVLNIDVVVEPRDKKLKSHAGIIVKSNDQYVINGRNLNDSIPKDISADDILQEIQSDLREIAMLDKYPID